MVREAYDGSMSSQDAIKRFAEGRLSKYEVVPMEKPTTFIRMIVLDVISDATSDMFDEEKKSAWEELGISNIREYSDSLPRNTIIAKRVGENSSPMFVFPFFPSHLALPCKPGELVWAMIENPENSNYDIAWWFGKVQTRHIADDVNHTHPARIFEYSMTPSILKMQEMEKASQEDPTKKVEPGEHVWNELRNGPVFEEDGNRYTDAEKLILRGEEEDIFEKLITSSNASDLISYEVVPRFRKRPGDVVLEGSNNSLIVLGSDRTGPLEKTKFDSYAGSIDIVVGRGQTKETFGKSASTTSILDAEPNKKGKELKKELNKSPDVLSKTEGDPDFKNDKSRILISQRTSVDDNFGLKSYNSRNFNINDDPQGDSSIVIKSDKLRFIARSDIEILVTGFNASKSPNDLPRKDQKEDSDNWASIVIKSNGDIVFKPSKLGVIKLGGDDANLAVLCEKATTGTEGSGIVTCATGITDTMGGIQGSSPEGGTGLGTFAKKVLLK